MTILQAHGTDQVRTVALTRRDRNEAAREYAGAINRAELDLVAFLINVPSDHRLSTAQAVRRRRTTEAHRYVHAAEIAQRMPELFVTFREDGRYSVDHLDALWSRINRHIRSLGDCEPATLDTAVALAVADWVGRTGITALTALADVADEALNAVAPLVVETTEEKESEEVRLTRRGTTLILDCGTQVVAESLWSAISDRALDLRRENMTESDTAPPMSWCRGQVMLEILGGTLEQLNVTVNLYEGSGSYVLGIGWISEATGAMLNGIAAHIRNLPDVDAAPVTSSYRFTAAQRALIEGRDGRCRFPGCSVAADRCEHDHLVNSPHTDPTSDGPTSVDNGISLCRTHHQLKTLGIWRVTSPDDAVTLHWSGPGEVATTTVASGPLSPAHLGAPA
jgi:hypothetical protein